MDVTKLKTWIGVALILLALSVAITARIYQDQMDIATWLYIATFVLFGFGFPMTLDMSFRSLFGSKKMPSYIYRPEIQQILVRFDSAPFEIERDGLRIRLVMMEGLPHSETDMYVCEPEIGIDFAFIASGLENGKEMRLRNGAMLYFTRQEPAGIKVWWSEVEKPWKIVEDK